MTRKAVRGPLIYKTGNGLYRITRWVKFPSYDFLFGVPLSKADKNNGEVAFFQVRFHKTKKARGLVLDEVEFKEFQLGFASIQRGKPF